MSQVQGGPGAGEPEQFLVKLGPAAPAHGQVFHAETQPQAVGELHQILESFEGGVPAQIRAGLPAQAAHVEGDKPPPQLRDETAGGPKDLPGPAGLLRIFVPQVQSLKGQVIAHLQGVQAGKGPGQLGLTRGAIREIVQGEGPVNPLKPQVQGELAKLFHLGDEVAAGEEGVLHRKLIQEL